MNYETKKMLRKEWIKHLKKQNTKYVITTTFRKDITNKDADIIAKTLLKMLRKEYFKRNKNRKFFEGYAVIEHQKNGRPHYHLLFADNEIFNRTDKNFELVIRRKCGSLGVIDPNLGVDFRDYYDGSLEGYLTKSIEWEQDDFDFIRPMTYDGF